MKSIAVRGVEINRDNRGFRGELGWVVLTFLLLAFSGRLWAAVPNLVTTDLSTIDLTCNLGFVDGHAESVKLNNLKRFYWHELCRNDFVPRASESHPAGGAEWRKRVVARRRAPV